MTEVERTKRMIELGYFDFFGLGTDVRAAGEALDAAARIDLARQEDDEDRRRNAEYERYAYGKPGIRL